MSLDLFRSDKSLGMWLGDVSLKEGVADHL